MDIHSLLSDSINKNTFRFRSNEDTFIFTLSDIHIGLGNKEYIRDIIRFIDNIPNARVVIGGDLIDNPTKGSKGDVLECYSDPQEQIELAVSLLKPIKNKIIAIIDSGNHEYRSYKESYISITQIISTLLGVPDKYIKDFAIGYLDIGNYCYIYGNIHKHRQAKDYYDYMNTDILILEHTHELSFTEKPIMYHNKYTKKTSIRPSYIIKNGSALAFPSYAKRAGYKMQTIGTYIVELLAKERRILIWRDIDLINALNNGYKGGR